MTIFVFSFGCETLAFSRLCALFDAVLARFRFTAWEAFDCCFSRSLFFSQELHTSRRLYLGLEHISPFLWLHPTCPVHRQWLQSVALHQRQAVGRGPGFFVFDIDSDRGFSSLFIVWAVFSDHCWNRNSFWILRNNCQFVTIKKILAYINKERDKRQFYATVDTKSKTILCPLTIRNHSLWYQYVVIPNDFLMSW